MNEPVTPNVPETHSVDVSTGDQTACRVVLQEMVKGLRSGKQSREVSLAITKLQEAEMWLMEALGQY